MKAPLFRGEKNILIGIIVISLLIFGTGFYLNFKNTGGEFFSRLTHALWIAWRNWLGPVYAILSFLLILVGIFSLIKYWPLRRNVSVFEVAATPRADKKRRVRDQRIAKQWNQLVSRANTGMPENLRLALLEADALVDYFLKTSGYEGEHMADRLSQILPAEVKSLENLWKAHRLRNDIVHTAGYVVSPKQAEEALFAYRDFLIELDAF